MNNRNCFITRTPVRRALGFFALAFMVVLLMTLSAGLIWCQPPVSTVASETSPVGTWVSADAWERGSTDSDTVIEFTDDGLMRISAVGFSALYRYEDGTLYLLDIEDSSAGIASGDISEPASTDNYKCVIAGDHMAFYGQIYGIRIHHGRTDLIRISSETGLSADDIAALY